MYNEYWDVFTLSETDINDDTDDKVIIEDEKEDDDTSNTTDCNDP
jgi:hypothetical protein